MGGGGDQVQRRGVGDAHARLLLGFDGGDKAWTLELLQVKDSTKLIAQDSIIQICVQCSLTLNGKKSQVGK